MRVSSSVRFYLDQIRLPEPTSHKGENGKLMIVGGSELFHAASKWSLDVASKFVDMVFYSSVPTNNELVHEAKSNFWNGIVIPRESLEAYIAEADCILVGPGMDRSTDTAQTVNQLLSRYPDKKWVIDAGGLQEVDPVLLSPQVIITPHKGELHRLAAKLSLTSDQLQQIKDLSTSLKEDEIQLLDTLTRQLHSPTILLKGAVDYVITHDQAIAIEGGNAGMTKGGTGDVLAGIVAALYCTHDAVTAAVVGSIANKQAGELLYEQVGPNFNASDLVKAVPIALWNLLQRRRIT
jgi:ADP-dependent NAD(P)H-hydrate dehydratase / NAD(P)H-hydrate epimerase